MPLADPVYIPLTRLPNLRLLMDRMDALLASLEEVDDGGSIDAAQQLLDNAFTARAIKQAERARDYTAEVRPCTVAPHPASNWKLPMGVRPRTRIEG